MPERDVSGNAAHLTRASSAMTGAWFIVLAALCWGLLGTIARVAFAEGAAPLTVAFWRATLGALMFGVHATVTRAAPLRPVDRTKAVALGGAGVALFYLAYLESVQRGGAALAAILLYSAPLWVAVGARAFFHERLSRRELLALMITLAGVGVVALASGGGASSLRLSPGALAWGLTSGATYALYYLLGRPLFAHNAPARVLVWALGVGAVVLLPFVTFQPMSLRAWTAVLFVSLVATYGAYLAYAHGLRRLPPSKAATIATLEPVVSVVAAYLVWGERLSLLGLAGAAAVIGGVLWSARR
jgi:DME family drug/metabolite transporter